MENPLELLLTLFIPAYAAGYLWLIKLARTDKPLYFLMESRLYRPVMVIAIAETLTAVGMAAYDWDNEEARAIHGILLMIFAYITWNAYHARAFFRRITRLPNTIESDDKNAH